MLYEVSFMLTTGSDLTTTPLQSDCIDASVLHAYYQTDELMQEVKRKRMESNGPYNEERNSLQPYWTRMKELAKNSVIQATNGQPHFPAYTAYQKIANILYCKKMFFEEDMRFVALAEGPGSMAMYLLAKYPHSRGTGITLKTHNRDWDWHDNLRMHARFNILDEMNGNLLARDLNWWEQKIPPNSVDLVIADGGMNEHGNEKMQETINLDLIQREFEIATSILKIGGMLIMKIYNTLMPESAALLFRIACCYSEITITHGITVRPNNQERYLVASGKLEPAEAAVNLLKSDCGIKQRFTSFMVRQNTLSIKLQTHTRWLTRNHYEGVTIPFDTPFPLDELELFTS